MTIREITQRLFDISIDTPNSQEALSPEKKVELLAISTFFNDPIEIDADLMHRLQHFPINADLHALTLIFLKRSFEPDLYAMLGLDIWEPLGEKQEACRLILDCLINQSNKLSLNGLGLCSLPPCIFTPIFSFTILYCGNNQLQELPDNFGRCARLREVHCFYNQLLAIPASIVQCTELRILDLSFNRLNGLVADMDRFTNLEILDLSYNRELVEIPLEIRRLPPTSLINISSTGLSEDVFAELRDEFLTPGYNGPRFTFLFSAGHPNHQLPLRNPSICHSRNGIGMRFTYRNRT